jgi:N-acylneuraminate cytidylyltransferase
MEVLAIIPARGGSKGISRKNMVKLNGQPLVAYSIQHALASKKINRLIVSTEDEEIAHFCRECGAEVPFMRPKELAEDHVLDFPVFEHALRSLKEKEGYEPELVVHLRPTAPYRKPEWIDEAVELLVKNEQADSVRSVSKPDKHPYRMFVINSQGFLRPIMKHEHPAPYELRRQELPEVYYYNCVIDVTRRRTIVEKKSMTGENMFPYIMDPEKVVDIDSRLDLFIAELMLSGKVFDSKI